MNLLTVQASVKLARRPNPGEQFPLSAYSPVNTTRG